MADRPNYDQLGFGTGPGSAEERANIKAFAGSDHPAPLPQPKPIQPLDPYRVLVVIYDASTGLFHAVFFGWAPFPGGIDRPIRLMSRDWTEGFATFEEAQAKLDQAVAEGFPAESAYRDQPIVCDHVDGLVWLASINWRANDPKAQFTPDVIMGCSPT